MRRSAGCLIIEKRTIRDRLTQQVGAIGVRVRRCPKKLIQSPPALASTTSKAMVIRKPRREERPERFSGESLVLDGWNASYALRHITWHVVDHLWEIEDRRA